ncbi:MAG: A/G-specific adenine glycosylase [Turicibacter sp.]|nr:A/G-specific adenine glycosylase [Turicibacter sp.]
MDKTLFQEDLLNWYRLVKRDLPWRQNLDPYRILVSEIMLQQTQVVTVIPYYERFLDWFPTPQALADASEEKLLKAWEGLGYYSRARNLQAAAQLIVENGGFPTTHEGILSLKGVGPYTAGAVGSIAFGLPVPAVDGNVFRVISRICLIFEDIMKAKTRKIFEEVVQALIPNEEAGDFNQALMELGATICNPKSPKCMECPVRRHCQAFKEGLDDQLPVKTKPMKQKRIKLVVGIVENQYGEILFDKRGESGLLPNFYEFRTLEYKGKMEPAAYLKENLKELGKVKDITPIGSFKHVFSHRIWEMEAFTVKLKAISDEVAEGSGIWVTPADLDDISLVTAHLKIWHQINGG